MASLIRLDSLRFGEPLYLWLLIAPGLLLCLWCWRVIRRSVDVRKYRTARLVTVNERFNPIGELSFWLALVVALTFTILALSRPQAVTPISGRLIVPDAPAGRD